MDIPKLSAAPTPLAASRRHSQLEVTISDRGVQIARPEHQPAPLDRPALQVTSEPGLQQVLSAEETQAIAQQFAAFRTSAASTLYSGRGTAVKAPLFQPQGQFVDLVG